MTASPAALLGREDEMRSIEVVLERHAPAVIVVSGRLGVGKTALLEWTKDRAGELGWTVLPSDTGDELSIGAETNAHEWWSRIASGLGDQDDSWATASPTPGERAEALADQTHGWLGEIARHAPIAILVDGYRPSEEFATWFAGGLIAGLRSRAIPAVIVVTAELLDGTSLTALSADEALELGPVPPDALEQHLRTAGGDLALPLAASELDTYVRLLSDRPDLIDRLTRLLTLARRNTTSAR